MRVLIISGTSIKILDTSCLINLEQLFAQQSKMSYVDTNNLNALKVLDVSMTNVNSVRMSGLTSLVRLGIFGQKIL